MFNFLGGRYVLLDKILINLVVILMGSHSLKPVDILHFKILVHIVCALGSFEVARERTLTLTVIHARAQLVVLLFTIVVVIVVVA